MSFATATQAEVIFSGFTAGTALTNTTTATVISPRGNTTALPYLPPGFYHPSYGANRRLGIRFRGVISTAASSPGTLTIAAAFAGTDTSTAGTTVIASGAFTPPTSLSNAIWDWYAELVCTAPGSAANFFGMGVLEVNPPNANGTSYGLGGTTAVTSVSTEAAQYVQCVATWGTSSASNTITMYDTSIIGWN